jgi:hypothetical protein
MSSMVVRASSAIDGQRGALVEMSPERLQLVGARWAGAEVLDPPAAGVVMCIAVPGKIDSIPRDGALVPYRSERLPVDDLGHWALRWPGVDQEAATPASFGAALDHSVANSCVSTVRPPARISQK